ncbi:hypothetical protein HPB49_024285 [Dermacentor silvarum]|uniref:Uncharacterized protein n=1 Tax=Dermacentor silvarum TaxID=543639 RepID=A0ACB8D900_DERSI|nr:hypothetical protein HPB49_024285 [Dermacentor silvarum]
MAPRSAHPWWIVWPSEVAEPAEQEKQSVCVETCLGEGVLVVVRAYMCLHEAMELLCGYTTEPQLEDLYWRFPGGGEGSYIHQWLNARRNASGLVIKNVYDELSRLPHFYYDRPVTYDRPHNAIVMPATAFMEPLFFADGTDAMRYGSLGSTLATKVLSVVACSRAKRDDGCGYPALFNLAATSRYDCDKDSASVATSELVALQVAYNGYVNASKESLDVRLKNLPDHSAVQVFFMVWCYTRCFDAGFRIEATFCDDVVADMPAFREVFGCESTWS